MSYTITNAVIALYVSDDGDIVASERVEGQRVIADNLLRTHPTRGDQTEILKVEISVDSQVVANGCCAGSTKYVMLRVCYDKFGNRYPCF